MSYETDQALFLRIGQYMTDIHKNAQEKGFWDDINDADKRDITLQLIITEVAELTEAMRKEKVMGAYTVDHANFIQWFESTMKGTVEEEVADIFIRGLDYVSGFRIRLGAVLKHMDDELVSLEKVKINQPAFTFYISGAVVNIKRSSFPTQAIGELLGKCLKLADHYGFNLWHMIDLKVKYNATRPYKHGGKRF